MEQFKYFTQIYLPQKNYPRITRKSRQFCHLHLSKLMGNKHKNTFEVQMLSFIWNGVVFYSKYSTKQKQCPLHPEQSSNHIPSHMFAQTCTPVISATFSLSINIFTTTTFSTMITHTELNSSNLGTSDPRARTRQKCGSRRPSPPRRPSPCAQLWESLEGEHWALFIAF